MSTFTIDAYKGWTEEQLKRRCLELVRAVAHKDVIIAVLAKGSMNDLHEVDREEVSRILASWED